MADRTAALVATKLLTVIEIASMLNISPRTLRRRIKDKTLPAVRIGRLVRIHPDDLAAFMRGELQNGDAEAND